MKNRTAIRILFGAVFLFGSFGIIAGDRIAIRLLFGCIVWIVLAGWILFERNVMRQHAQRSLEVNNEQLLKSIQLQRHDWMNDLQVLYGYISLKKYDKLVPLVDKIKERLTQENSISKLGIPSLIFFLHSFRANESKMELDIRVEGDVNLRNIPIDGAHLANSLSGMIDQFQEAIDPEACEMARLRVVVMREENSLKVEFHPEGLYIWAQLENGAANSWLGRARWIHEGTNRTLEWTVPFDARARNAINEV